MNLYMTVGVPGGEYFCWADDIESATLMLRREALIKNIQQAHDGHMPNVPVIIFRLAPQDVVDWVLAKMHDVVDTHAGLARMKVETGWLWISNDAVAVDESQEYTQYQYALTAMHGVPIDGTANLTVINPEDAPDE